MILLVLEPQLIYSSPFTSCPDSMEMSWYYQKSPCCLTWTQAQGLRDSRSSFSVQAVLRGTTWALIASVLIKMLSFSCPTQVHSPLERGKQLVQSFPARILVLHLAHVVFWVANCTSATGFPCCSWHPETLLLDVVVSAEVMTPCESKQMHPSPPRGSKRLLSCPLLGTTDLKPHTKPQGRRVQKLCHNSFMFLLPHLFAS